MQRGVRTGCENGALSASVWWKPQKPRVSQAPTGSTCPPLHLCRKCRGGGQDWFPDPSPSPYPEEDGEADRQRGLVLRRRCFGETAWRKCCGMSLLPAPQLCGGKEDVPALHLQPSRRDAGELPGESAPVSWTNQCQTQAYNSLQVSDGGRSASAG